MATQLTQHFTLEEFTFSQTASRQGLDNTPTPAARTNLELLAETLERVRMLLGNQPILISSGYRSPSVNAACGGATNSAHMSGLAADFTCPSFGSPLQICQRLEEYLEALDVDQLIHEYDGWVHLAIAAAGADARCQCLTINSSGTTTGFA